MTSPTASSVTCGRGVAVPVGMGEIKGDVGRRKGDGRMVETSGDWGRGIEDRVAEGRIGGEDLPALQAVKARRVMNKHIDKYLFFIINLNFQLHLPDGF
jgi:lysozyme family protein